ncbi:MAG: hypothetical protein Q8O95_00030 [bacterium]|nr:hypothetical protein [bacterium]
MKNPLVIFRRLSKKAIILGSLVDSGLSLAIGGVLAITVMLINFKQFFGNIEFLLNQKAFNSLFTILTSSSCFLVLGGILGLLGTAIGGYVAGKYAHKNPYTNAIATSLFTMIFFWLVLDNNSFNPPTWFLIAANIITWPTAIFGAYLSTLHSKSLLKITTLLILSPFVSGFGIVAILNNLQNKGLIIFGSICIIIGIASFVMILHYLKIGNKNLFKQKGANAVDIVPNMEHDTIKHFKRPILASLMAIVAILTGLSLGLLVLAKWNDLPSLATELLISEEFLALSLLILIGIYLSAGIGLIMRRKWGWGIMFFAFEYSILRCLNFIITAGWIYQYDFSFFTDLEMGGKALFRILLSTLLIIYFYRQKVAGFFHVEGQEKRNILNWTLIPILILGSFMLVEIFTMK